MTTTLPNRSFIKLIFIWLLIICLVPVKAAIKEKINWKKVKVLVYTKNGKGYVHDNIPAAVTCIQQLGQAHGFKVEVSDKPEVFSPETLNQYTLLIFTSTNNDVFDTDQQRLAFRRYIQAGGGFVGIHSVTGTERNWTWFKQMLGGTFVWHAKNQKFRVNIIDPAHPTAQGLPRIWERQFGDECYFAKELYPGIKVIMAHDLSSIDPQEADKVAQFSAPFRQFYPAVWHQQFDGGNIWVTTLGHNKEYYQEPIFVKHIFQGIRFIAGQAQKLDYTKAYADARDTPVRY